MRWKMVVCVGWLAPLVGCMHVRPASQSAAPAQPANARTEQLAQAESRAVWQELVRRHPSPSQSAEFADGFSDGYVAVAETGGPVDPPTIPPARYRRTSYQTAEGQELVGDYVKGFRYGAAVAQAAGVRPSGTSSTPTATASAAAIAPTTASGLPTRPTVPKYEPAPAGSGSFLARMIPSLAPSYPLVQVADPSAAAMANAAGTTPTQLGLALAGHSTAPSPVYPAAYRHTVDNGYTASYIPPQAPPIPRIALPDPLPLYPRPAAAVVQTGATGKDPTSLPPPDLGSSELAMPAPPESTALPTITVDPISTLEPNPNNYRPEVLPPVSAPPAPIPPVKTQPAPIPPAARTE